ncbi:MAG TPA: FeoA family protein [Coxiellaceae bacterium]|nr:FeoA family protein [Coxiellaceae bacterium]
MTELAELMPGERGRVCGFHKGNPEYKQRLLAMGFTPNTEFTVIRKAPLGDPIQVEVRNFQLSLRKKEAEFLRIERVL